MATAMRLAWTGWPGPLLTSDSCGVRQPSMLEPIPDVGLLQDGAQLAALSARDLVHLFLCTCTTLRRRLSRAEDVMLGILQHRWVGQSTALQVSSRCRHFWRHHAAGSRSCLGARALRWLDRLECAAFFDDLRRPARHPQRCLDWQPYGDLVDDQNGDRREVEAADDDAGRHSGWWEEGVGELTRCLSLRIGRTYGQSSTHFGRGAVCRTGDACQQPRHFSCLFRLRFDRLSPSERARKPTLASVGYLILSDGAPDAPSSHGLFGTEAVFLMILIGPNHRARLLAVDDEGERVVVPLVRQGSWVQIRLRLDWARRECALTYHDFASASWPEPAPDLAALSTSGGSVLDPIKLRFRGACSHLGQVSLLSVSDQGHATCAWTDFVIG